MEARMDALVIFFFLAIVQVQGGQGMTFGTMEECQTVRGQAVADPSVMFISDCIELKLTPVTIPKENKT